jgi:hypothetical protein
MAGVCRLLTSFLWVSKAVQGFVEKREKPPFLMTQEIIKSLFEIEGVLHLGATQIIMSQYETLFNGAMPSLMKGFVFRQLQ